ncbi:MAG TPA: sigma factor-like helix-turn-helix DNA-binding protein, partial [Planctomycetota bacterium]|nr:sigma factor-like helix-turn-helix DNA-binding protein [Planctomycetota bacterium]
REVLLLRYLKELAPTEIAARTGEPLATVKSRLQRGLALLRERLDRDGADWRPALCAAFGLERAAPVAAAAALSTTGVLLMGTGVKLAIGGAAAAIAVAATLFFAGGAPVAAPIAATGWHDPTVAAATREHGTPASNVTDGVATQRTENKLVTGPAGPLATVRGRCLDASGNPIDGVHVTMTGGEDTLPRMFEWLRRHKQPAPIEQQVTTAADGRFELTCWPPPPFKFRLELARADLATMIARWEELAPGLSKDVGDVAMVPGVQVRGIVTEADGAIAPNVSVSLRPEQMPRGEPAPLDGISATTHEDGTFMLAASLTPGAYHVVVMDRDVEQNPVRLMAPATDLRIVLRPLDPQRTIAGIVVDETGEPLAGVQIRSDYESWRSQLPRTDRKGHFTVVARGPGEQAAAAPSSPVPDTVALTLEKDGYESPRPARPVAWGQHDLRFVLHRDASVIVQVTRGPDGAAVEDFRLFVRRHPEAGADWTDHDSGLRSSGKHHEGRAQLALPRGDYSIAVEPESDDLATSALVPLSLTDLRVVHLDVPLDRVTHRIVRLQRHDGTPVVGSCVQQCAPSGATALAGADAFPLAQWSRHPGGAGLLLAESTTDVNGEVRLAGATSATFTLLLIGPGHAPDEVPGVRLDIEEPLVITVSNGATLRGRCTPPEALVELRRLAQLPDHGPVEARLRHRLPAIRLGQLRGTTTRSFPSMRDPPVPMTEEGTFLLDGAPVGVWEVQLCWTYRSGFSVVNSNESVADVRLCADTVTEVVVDLSSLLPGDLDGLVLHDGAPMVGSPLHLTPLGNSPLVLSKNVTTDAEGRFHCSGDRGQYRLGWNLEPELLADETVFITPGRSTAQTFHLRTGTLRVRLLDSRGTPAVGVSIELRDAEGHRRHQLSATRSDGTVEQLLEAQTFVCMVLPAALLEPKAQAELRAANPNSNDPFGEVLLRLGEVTVKQGETTTLDLHLPADWDH